MRTARNHSKLMIKRKIQAQSLLKISLISFSFASLASFCVLVSFSAAGLGSPFVQLMPIAALALSLGVIHSLGVVLLIYGLFLRPLHQLEQEMAALASDPELILPSDDDISSHNQDIQRLRTQILSLSTAVRQTIRQRQRLADIGEAVAKINHDLRNMLASAMLVIDQLEHSSDPRVSEAAPVVIKATEQASLLCQNMLDYLTEMPRPEAQIVAVEELVQDLQNTTELQINWQGPDRLYIDKMMIHRLLFNLARNAGQAGATILNIDIWQAGHLAVIDMSDNGPGIAADMRQSLFRAFASGQPTGYGLGLAICLDMALALGGRLRLSRSTDQGSEFRLQLPASCLSAQT